jgi:hypothetical protein
MTAVRRDQRLVTVPLNARVPPNSGLQNDAPQAARA